MTHAAAGEDGTRGFGSELRAASGEDGTRGFGFLWGLLRCWGCVLTTGVVIRRRAASGETARGALIFCFVGGAGAACFEGCCGSGNAKRSFAGRIPKRSLGTTQTTQKGRGAVAVCFEGCCGSMCWPQERPATHAAAGAAARGALIFCLVLVFWGGIVSHAREGDHSLSSFCRRSGET